MLRRIAHNSLRFYLVILGHFVIFWSVMYCSEMVPKKEKNTWKIRYFIVKWLCLISLSYHFQTSSSFDLTGTAVDFHLGGKLPVAKPISLSELIWLHWLLWKGTELIPKNLGFEIFPIRHWAEGVSFSAVSERQTWGNLALDTQNFFPKLVSYALPSKTPSKPVMWRRSEQLVPFYIH